MSTSEKVHKTLRIERDLADKVKALATGGETETAVYIRVISAGVEALQVQPDTDKDKEPAEAPSGLVEALSAHIDTLKADNERLAAQLDIKDRQIEALSVLTAQAQQTTTKALEAPQEQQSDKDSDKQQRRGFFARLFG